MNKVDQLALPMLSDFKQVENAQKTGFSRQGRSDVWKADQLNGIYLNLAVLYSISGADAHSLTLPESNGARDVSVADAIPDSLVKHHSGSP